MLDPEFSIRNEFPPVPYDAWRALAEASLQGAPFEKKLVTRTYEGLELQPLYTREDRLDQNDGGGLPSPSLPDGGLPGWPPFVRGASPLGAVLTGWDLRQLHASPQLAVANEAILADLEGGVSSLLLQLDRTARSGLDPDDDEAVDFSGADGLMAYHAEDLDVALAGVDLSMVGIALEPGAAFLPAAALLVALWRRRGTPPDEARGAFNADPLAVPARDGKLPITLEAALAQMADLAAWTSANYPQVTTVGVDTAIYHHAGATAAQDLAFAMATAVQYLRAMTDSGLELDAAAKQILFRISLGTHHFLAIAKLRAGRRLWSRVVEACGGSTAASAMRVHARTSDRVLTQHDPYVNLLRNTVAVFAAGIGGASAITSLPFDYVTGQTDSFSRRVARNTGLILQEEAHLHRVIDPAGGSWFLENLTDQVAEKAWEIFQEIEHQGGMIQVLEAGWVAEQIAAAFAPRAKDIATRKAGITGVSEFPNLEDAQVVHRPPPPEELLQAAVERIQGLREEGLALPEFSSAAEKTETVVQAAMEGATLGQMADALGFDGKSTNIFPMETRRFAEPFEELRAASDAWQAMHGNRPRVFLANMGPLAHHTGRASYANSFFEAGGFEVVTNEGFRDADAAASDFVASGASIAVICSSDKLYPEFVPAVASRLKAVGASTVVLAGKPGPNEAAWRTAGVDRFIFISCDVLGTLRELLREEGVLTS